MLVLTSAGRSLLFTLMLFVSANKRDWLNTRLGVLDVFTLNVHLCLCDIVVTRLSDQCFLAASSYIY